MVFEIMGKLPETGNNANYVDYTTKWCGVDIAKKHSFLTVVKQIVNHQLFNEVTTVGVQGREGSGKTNLVDILAHLLHLDMTKMATNQSIDIKLKAKLKIGYSVHKLGEPELKELKATLLGLPRNNRIIIFDDVSFMNGSSSKRDIDQIKQAMTTIRHHDETLDVKTIMIFCYHYSKGLDKYLRDTTVKFFTSIGPEEATNILSLVSGQPNKTRVESFLSVYSKFSMGGTARFFLGEGKDKKRNTRKSSRIVQYKYNEPFRLFLYYNNSDVRFCVLPVYSALIKDECVICSNTPIKSTNTEDVVKWLIKQYSLPAVKKAARYELYRVYGNIISQGHDSRKCHEALRRLIVNGIIKTDELVSLVMDNNKQHIKTVKQAEALSPDIRQAFTDNFNIDGLRSAHDTKLKNLD